MRKIIKWLLATRQDKFATLSLIMWLLIGRILTVRVVSWLGGERQAVTTDVALLTGSQRRIILRLKGLMRVIVVSMPWDCSCLLQAFAVGQVLKHYRIPYVVYFGVKKGDEKQLQAHAWLSCDDVDVTGGENKMDFKVINYFGWSPV